MFNKIFLETLILLTFDEGRREFLLLLFSP